MKISIQIQIQINISLFNIKFICVTKRTTFMLTTCLKLVKLKDRREHVGLGEHLFKNCLQYKLELIKSLQITGCFCFLALHLQQHHLTQLH